MYKYMELVLAVHIEVDSVPLLQLHHDDPAAHVEPIVTAHQTLIHHLAILHKKDIIVGLCSTILKP